jgi:hypothetical protein
LSPFLVSFLMLFSLYCIILKRKDNSFVYRYPSPSLLFHAFKIWCLRVCCILTFDAEKCCLKYKSQGVLYFKHYFDIEEVIILYIHANKMFSFYNWGIRKVVF